MKTPSFLLVFCMAAAYADGLSPMKLEAVLPRADAVTLVQIVSCSETITERDGAGGRKSVQYSYHIRVRTLSPVKGVVPGELDFVYEAVVVKGVWLAWPGSGLEMHMKPKERYLFLLTSRDDKLQLLRAEKGTVLQTVKGLLTGQGKEKPANQ